MKRILITANYELTQSQQNWFLQCPNGCHDRAQFVFNSSGDFDLVCQINWSYGPHFVKAPRNQFVKLVQEPNWPGHLTHRFVTHHRKIFRTIRGHTNIDSKKNSDDKFQFGYAFLPHHVSDASLPEKTRDFSLIASRMRALPGHERRTRFVDEISDFWTKSGGSVFGRGRTEIASKEEGLDVYRYSLVIENTKIPNYVTEKFTDAILRGAVPIYYGAPNIGELFPEGSFIRLEELSIGALQAALTGLGESDYESRREALVEAQRRLTCEFRLCCWLTSELSKVKPGSKISTFIWSEGSGSVSRLRRAMGKFLRRT